MAAVGVTPRRRRGRGHIPRPPELAVPTRPDALKPAASPSGLGGGRSRSSGLVIGAQVVAGDVGVARRRVELGAPEQYLDYAHVDGVLEQMRGKGVLAGYAA